MRKKNETFKNPSNLKYREYIRDLNFDRAFKAEMRKVFAFASINTTRDDCFIRSDTIGVSRSSKENNETAFTHGAL